MYSSGFYPYDTLEEYWAFWRSEERRVGKVQTCALPIS